MIDPNDPMYPVIKERVDLAFRVVVWLLAFVAVGFCIALVLMLWGRA